MKLDKGSKISLDPQTGDVDDDVVACVGGSKWWKCSSCCLGRVIDLVGVGGERVCFWADVDLIERIGTMSPAV